MTKRSSVVMLSSDEEEDAKTKGFVSRVALRSKPSADSRGFSSAPRSSKSTKKARCFGSRSAPSKERRGFNEVCLPSNNVQGFSIPAVFLVYRVSFKINFHSLVRQESSSGFKNIGHMESWVEKYRPCTVEELAVHKKKVEEVREWLEHRLIVSKRQQLDSHTLLINGPAGVGKSATIQVLASHFGANLFEWDAPTPTIWQEHVHNNNSGVSYISKLDEFENFVERVRKFGLLPSSTSLSSLAPVILLIDDLPVVKGKIAYRRLLRCLKLLAISVEIPTVIVVTDYGGAESGDNNNIRSSEELWLSCTNAGAYKVAFNPVTVNSIKKVLSRICRQEQCNTSSEEVDFIANASGGDIRNAIQSLQYLCLHPRPSKSIYFSVRTPISSEGKTSCANASECGSLPFGRDQTLSLFHALGKFLHNKRDTENTSFLVQHEFCIRGRFSRLPLKMDGPEKVLCQAFAQARQVVEFLHENVLDFLGEEAVEDAWVVASYLSDADCLVSSLRQMFGANYTADNIAQSAAASVAARGVLFGNAHPSLPRWHTIRKPKLWQVEQSVRLNKYEMERRRFEVQGLDLFGLSVFSVVYRPMLLWLQRRATSSSSDTCDDGASEFNFTSLEQGLCESTDDDIEDF